MDQDREARTHAATGIEFEFAGRLGWGPAKFSADISGDVEAWRCSRCHALVVGEIDAHAGGHVQVDDLAASLDRVASGALKPRTDADRVNDEARERRLVAYRDALAAGAVWRETPTGHALEVGPLLGAPPEEDYTQATWTDSASVREVPPS